MNVRYAVLHEDHGLDLPEPWCLQERNEELDFLVQGYESWLPRFVLVADSLCVADRQAAVRLLDSGAIDPRQTVALEDPDGVGSGTLAALSDASVSVEEQSVHYARLTVHAPAPAFLFRSESYHRVWKAYVDGRRVPIVPANGGLQAIAVPPGEHVVEFRCRRAGLLLGCAISLATLVGLPLAPRLVRRLPSARRYGWLQSP
jgi:hypothetical protein